MRALLVDGYNVLSASPRYKRLAETDIEFARAALVKDVAAFAVGTYRAVVVFDGRSNPSSDGSPHRLPGVVVIFSPYGSDADAVLEGLVHRHRGRGDEVVIVTSDAQLQATVMGQHVSRMSAKEFVDALEVGSNAWREHNPHGSRRLTLDALVEPSVRETLSRWARGEREPHE
jgi:uncharacterized protein